MKNIITSLFTGPLDWVSTMSRDIDSLLMDDDESSPLPMDMTEEDNKYVIRLDLGKDVKKDNICVQIYYDTVRISVSLKKESKNKDGKTERTSYRKMTEEFTLPEDAVTNTVQAGFKDGVITVTADKYVKDKQEQVKDIPISES